MAIVNEIFIEGGPFTKDLGIRAESIEDGNALLQFKMRKRHVGLNANPMLHGGVIASVLDIAGGIVVFLGATRKTKINSVSGNAKKLQKLNIIDLRIDYLRPGIGGVFTDKGYILCTENKVAVARMELYNDEQDLVAVGTGSYIFAVG